MAINPCAVSVLYGVDGNCVSMPCVVASGKRKLKMEQFVLPRKRAVALLEVLICSRKVLKKLPKAPKIGPTVLPVY